MTTKTTLRLLRTAPIGPSHRQATQGTQPSAQRVWIVALLTCSALIFACRRPTPKMAGDDAEAPLAQQVATVRLGNSHQLRLDHTVVTDDDLAQLDGLEDQLLRINFSRTQISDAGLNRLAHLTKLEQLRIASPRITDAGMPLIGQLTNLRFLHLLDAPITDAGLDALHGLKRLESLYLDGTRVTDAGIARLVEAVPGVHLHLDDHHHRLDPHAAEHDH